MELWNNHYQFSNKYQDKHKGMMAFGMWGEVIQVCTVGCWIVVHCKKGYVVIEVGHFVVMVNKERPALIYSMIQEPRYYSQKERRQGTKCLCCNSHLSRNLQFQICHQNLLPTHWLVDDAPMLSIPHKLNGKWTTSEVRQELRCRSLYLGVSGMHYSTVQWEIAVGHRRDDGRLLLHQHNVSHGVR